MNFAIIWTGPALDQLAEIWLRAADRAAVTAASYRIEATILADPLRAGESRDHEERIVVDAPLAAFYNVDRARQVVAVTAVTSSRRV